MAKTFVVTVRLDVEDVATIAGYMAQKKAIILSRSHPVCAVVDMMANMIRDQHPSLTFNLPQSVEFLTHLGIATIEGNKGNKEIFRQLGNLELASYDRTITCPIPKSEPENHEMGEARKIFEETYRQVEEDGGKARRDEELKNQIKGFQDITGLDVED